MSNELPQAAEGATESDPVELTVEQLLAITGGCPPLPTYDGGICQVDNVCV